MTSKIRSFAGVFVLHFALAHGALAADFVLPDLPKTQEDRDYGLKADCDGGTYYSFMESTIHPQLLRIARKPSRRSNEDALREGLGLAVQLDGRNYNFHVNYPSTEQGGRSYGWTDGQVGDWSDKMYLERLSEVVSSGSDRELDAFYRTVIELLGACDPSGLSGLDKKAQRVANNFLAIYTAEQYRAMVGTSKWDDALLQVTLVAAFHGGQKTFTKFYLGEFTSKSFKQAPGVYRGSVEGKPKRAEMNDYWQFSANPDSRRSGINLTRRDFEAMGRAITDYVATEGESRALGRIRKVVGDDPNVIKAITRYFTQNKANPGKTEALAKDVAELLVQVRRDADAITAWVKKRAR
jgi:hypothetical protein